jgi:DNA-directed RNA polymerase specialized sigma24 family protein
MSQTDDTRRNLDEIPTQWSLLRLAHQDATAAGPARQALLLRYNGAIRRYIGGMIRNPHDADEVAQDVVVRLMRGDFAGADSRRGRFRDLLGASVRNMVRNFWNKQNRRRGANLDLAYVEGGSVDPAAAADAGWLAHWQSSVLDLAWHALEESQRATPGNVFYTLLRLRAEHPDDDSSRLAELLTRATGKSFRADNVRQQLRRARLRFAELLLEEIARGLAEPTPENVQEELVALGLMDYVRDFLPRDWKTRGELASAE